MSPSKNHYARCHALSFIAVLLAAGCPADDLTNADEAGETVGDEESGGEAGFCEEVPSPMGAFPHVGVTFEVLTADTADSLCGDLVPAFDLPDSFAFDDLPIAIEYPALDDEGTWASGLFPVMVFTHGNLRWGSD